MNATTEARERDALAELTKKHDAALNIIQRETQLALDCDTYRTSSTEAGARAAAAVTLDRHGQPIIRCTITWQTYQPDAGPTGRLTEFTTRHDIGATHGAPSALACDMINNPRRSDDRYRGQPSRMGLDWLAWHAWAYAAAQAIALDLTARHMDN